jgi:hypothetical protein
VGEGVDGGFGVGDGVAVGVDVGWGLGEGVAVGDVCVGVGVIVVAGSVGLGVGESSRLLVWFRMEMLITIAMPRISIKSRIAVNVRLLSVISPSEQLVNAKISF